MMKASGVQRQAGKFSKFARDLNNNDRKQMAKPGDIARDLNNNHNGAVYQAVGR
jgi:hypothetical protein